MGTKEKLVARFSALPADFTWDEMRRLLVALGYVPGNIVKGYVMKQVYDYLKSEGLI